MIQSQQCLAQSRGSLHDEIEDMIVPKHHLQLGEIVGQGNNYCETMHFEAWILNMREDDGIQHNHVSMYYCFMCTFNPRRVGLGVSWIY